MKFFTALLKVNNKCITLIGNDAQHILTFPMSKTTSPSLTSLWEEEVNLDENSYTWIITFKHLSADAVISKIKEFNKPYAVTSA